ncbi:MAG: TonB-dependent receptor [Phycisphaerales bacterium]
MCNRIKTLQVVFFLSIPFILTLSANILAAEPNNVEAKQNNSQTNDGDNGQTDMFEMSLEELMQVEVTSAGFFATTTMKAPGYIMVYDMNEINNTSVRTLGDLLELYVPGSIVGSHERQGRLHGVRGLLLDNNAKTLVMIDGQQINYRSHFGYMVGLLSPFLGDMSKIEIINGPGAIQHGSGAINGFINMIPKTGLSHPGFFSRYEFGLTEESNLFEAGYGFNYGDRRNLYVYGGAYDARGFEPDETFGYTMNYDQDTSAFGYNQGNYRFSTTWNHYSFNLNWFNYVLHPQKNSTNEPGHFVNQTMGLRPKYKFTFSETDSLDLIGSFIWADFGVTGHNGNLYLKGGSERHWEIKPIYKTTRIGKHQLAIGGSYGYKKFRTTDFYFNHKPIDGFESIDTEWYETSLFAEDVISLTDKLTFVPGVRYDEYDLDEMSNFWPATMSYKPKEIKGHISPRFAFAYEVDKTTNIKGAYQHGFRMPDASYYQFNVYNNSIAKGLGLPTFPLKEETMDSWELNFQKVFSKKLEVGLNLFYNTFTDQLAWGNLPAAWSSVTADWSGDPGKMVPGMFQNTDGRFHIWGFEPIIKYDLTDNTTIDTSYGYAKVINNNVTQRYPEHQVKLNLMSRFLEDRLKVGISYVYNSRYTHSMSPGIHSEYEKPRHLVDLSVVYKVNKNLNIKGVVKNVLADDTPPSSNQMDRPAYGNLGYSEPRYYFSVEMKF